MLKVLAVAALIAASEAVITIKEYSGTAIKPINDEATLPAVLINSDRGFTFKAVVDHFPESVVRFYSDALPVNDQPYGHEICGTTLGIEIKDVGIFCSPAYFILSLFNFKVPIGSTSQQMRGHRKEEETGLEYILLSIKFQTMSEEEEKPFNLEIPIYGIPEDLAGETREIKKWAKKNKVGLLSQDDLQMLSGIDVTIGAESTIHFNWLSGLLTLGIVPENKGTYSMFVHTYSTRPIVLSHEDLEILLNSVKLRE